ncbi:MAG TPA: 23S rRNA (adenine(2503)-C(2))-methyltransferase RlmN [Bacteroidales bacterium]|nr:23S rRNA (adenine(2503)-C(2))-methyltransferase RlmN [Bacteroidales bacterium]
MQKTDICGLTPEEIITTADIENLTVSQVLRIVNNIYKKGVKETDQIPGIPAVLKNKLKEKFYITNIPPIKTERSSDGSVKYLFQTGDGRKFEAVYLPDKKRHTLCISSQSGCRMACPFCATGKYGFHGDLSASEILNQVISIPESGIITHIVFMGMGEPMDNLDNVLKACKILTAEWGCAIGQKNITVSTVGITTGISRFLEASGCNLTLSLFSPFFDERKKIIPVERKFPAGNIIDLLKTYPSGKKRRFTLSYVMIDGLNDTDAHLEKLKNLLSGSNLRVNLLPYHSSGDDSYVSSSAERMMTFKHNLIISGISASIRKSRGADISAACGLLASK